MRPAKLALALSLAVAPGALAQGNASLTLSEEALNRLVARIGVPSDSGLFQPQRAERDEHMICHPIGFIECPGLLPPGTPWDFPGHRIPLEICRSFGSATILPAAPPVAWSWWVTDASFSIKPGSMTFTATVRSQVGRQIETRTRTVAAWIAFESASNRLRLEVGDFEVPLSYEQDGVVYSLPRVAVDDLFALAIPLEPRTLTVPPIQYTDPIEIRGRVQSLPNVTYSMGSLRVAFDLSFSRQ